MSQQEHDKRIDYVEFPATDLEATRDFYAGAFGWEFTEWGDAYMSFEDGRLGGGLRKVDAVATGVGPLVVIYVVDLASAEAAVREQGGEILKDIFEFPGGRRFHFSDPSGNELAAWSDR